MSEAEIEEYLGSSLHFSVVKYLSLGDETNHMNIFMIAIVSRGIVIYVVM